MTFNLYGKANDKTFDTNNGGWRWLLTLVDTVAPNETTEDWGFNSGHKVSSATAIRIADKLDAALANGLLDIVAVSRELDDAYRQRVPGLIVEEADEAFLHQHLAEFIAFLRQSGGFAIW